MLTNGDIFLERYRIESQIGCGGMGAVYAAVDVDLNRRVAVKILLPEIASSPLAATRFVNEGRAAARVGGEHVARVFGAGRTPEGLSFMILEYLEGVDLEVFLQENGRLEIDEAVDILLQALEGVAEAHLQGIVHRDLKPANLFLHRRNDGSYVVKIIDFGVSKASRPLTDVDGEHELTATRTLLGSPAYMSPEQLYDSKRVDPRTDIWSLGVILYEMLAGVAPFEEKSLSDLVIAILHKTPPPLGELRPDVPPGLEAVLARCLARDREHRTASASALAAELTPFGSRGSHERLSPAPLVSAHPAPVEQADTEPAPAMQDEPTPFSGEPPPSSKDARTHAWAFMPHTPIRLQLSFFLVMLAAFAVLCAAGIRSVLEGKLRLP